MSDNKPRNDMPYAAACHAMQTGVQLEISREMNDAHKPKQLRVGINSAMVNDAAMARLLIKKGIITQEEYAEEVRLEMNREVDRYENALTEEFGRTITLG